MKTRLKAIVISVLLLCTISSQVVMAKTPYKTYTVDGYGYVSETQTAYTPYDTITKVGETAFVSPMDICISDDLIYIADSGAKVILVCDKNGEEISKIGEGKLTTPTGVYVTEDSIYVADKDGGKVVVFDKKGNVKNEYGKPDSPIYGETMDFKPSKIVTNASGTMYIICEGNMNGIVQISPVDNGSFLGYFGTNYTSLSPFDIMKRIILTDEQRAKLLSNIPSTPTNLSIDKEGLIYTVTQGDKDLSLKKLNIAGNNLLESDSNNADLPAAVTTGNYKNILVADTNGYIYEYNEEGDLLFLFGGRDDGRERIGLCNKVEAIGVDTEDKVYLLDSDKKQINIFEPTEFTKLLHESLYYYSKGDYDNSKKNLEQVLKMNSLFDYANKAIGNVYYQDGNYEAALKYARLAKDYDGYSDAYWEIRNTWIRNNVVKAFAIIILIVLLLKAFGAYRRKHPSENKFLKEFNSRTLVKQLKYSVRFMRHPLDGCYAVKNEGKASYVCTFILLAVFTVISILNKYYCGFLLKTVREGRYDIFNDAGTVLLIFFGLIICNYLVVTINDGEGSIKQLFSAYAYCLTPYIVIKPFVILLGNVLTHNEVFLVEFGNIIIWTWVVVLVVLTLKEVNDYSVRDTSKSIFITAFTVLILALLVCVIYVLCSQVVDFIIAVAREVVYRIAN